MIGAFLEDEAGQSMVETALIIALVTLIALVGLQFLGGRVGDYYEWIGEQITNTTAS